MTTLHAPLASSPALAPFPNAAYDVVALVASAGGLQALMQILAGLPAHFPAALVIVEHLSPHHPSHMADILSRCTALRVKQAQTHDRLEPGCVYIAPPDHHLLVTANGCLRLSHSDRVHFVRPSADVLLDAVATHYGPRAIAVVLSGCGHDGADGIRAIKAHGGITMAQDASSAQFTGMPSAAIHTGKVDLILPLSEIAPAMMSLVMIRGATP